MIRICISFFLLFHLVYAQENINNQIKSTSSKINTFSKNYTSLNKKLAKNAKEILKERLVIQKQTKFLQELKVQLSQKELSYKANKSQLKGLKVNNEKLKQEQNEIEQELVFVIAQSVSLSVILEDEYAVNEESLIEFEILKKMLDASKEKAAVLNRTYYSNAKNIDNLSQIASGLRKAISNIDKKRKKLLSVQKKNKKSLKNLTLAKSSYKKKVKKLIRKQDALKSTLAKLNIIKVDEAKKAKVAKERKLAFANKKEILDDKNLPHVKQHASSYQAIKTKKYKGAKTIAPLDSYTISKKYGTYTDPIYGIKIFNESISLKSKKRNAKVKTVFNGKVIYADKTAVLDNIVIVEHKGGLHTIYANLSQISPNIKKGKKIKKGYTIGRVNEELIFEVTQKSYHINPIRLFK